MRQSLADILTLEEMKRVIDKANDWRLHEVLIYEVVLSSDTLGIYEKTYGLENVEWVEELLAYLYATQPFIKGIEWELSYQYARYLFPYNSHDMDVQRIQEVKTIGAYTVLYVPYSHPDYPSAVWLIENPEFDIAEFEILGKEELRKNLLMWTQWLSTARQSDNAQIMAKVAYDLTSSGKYRLVFNISADDEDFASFYIQSESGKEFKRIRCSNYKSYILNAIDLIPEMSEYLGSDVTRLILPNHIPKPKSE